MTHFPPSVSYIPPVCPEHRLPMALTITGKKAEWVCRDEGCSVVATFTGSVPHCPTHGVPLQLKAIGTARHKRLCCPLTKPVKCRVELKVQVEKWFQTGNLPDGSPAPIPPEFEKPDGIIQQRLEGFGSLFPLSRPAIDNDEEDDDDGAAIEEATEQAVTQGLTGKAPGSGKKRTRKTAFGSGAGLVTETLTVTVDETSDDDNDDDIAEWLRPGSKIAPMKTRYTVGEVTRLIQGCLEEHPTLGRSIVVEGELSNVKRSSRGHIYFTLKDVDSSIGGILWAGVANRLSFDLRDGQAVYLTGKLEVYGRSGTYSLVASRLEPVGIGALQLAFEQIKARLDAEGLFMPEFKKDLPDFPQRIGIVTSPTGAVIHDMLRVIRRKNEFMDVLLAPVKVQGDGAAEDIATAIRELNHPAYNLDALIVARGGGSFEDLFCFSEESVIRAVFDSRLPIVTGIGHEPDFSLADAAADYSASTPTAAADWLTPDVGQMLALQERRLQDLMQGVATHLLYYERALDDSATHLIEQHSRLIDREENQINQKRDHLLNRAEWYFEKQEKHLAHAAANLSAFNPLATLARGYGVATASDTGKVIGSVEDIGKGQSLDLRLSDGHLHCRVLGHTKSLS